MAAYAALASLCQTTDLIRNQNKPLFSVPAEDKIRSIHEYVTVLLSFLEEFPEKAKQWEGKMRDLAHEAEDIIEQFMSLQSYNRRIILSSVKFEEQLRNVSEKLCLMAGDVMDERPASYSARAVSTSSSCAGLSPIGNSAVVGLDDDLMAVKGRLCGMTTKLQIIPIVGMGGIVSQDYNARKVLLGLVNSMKLMEKEMSRDEIDDSTMMEKVYKNLKGRRYLIVMDDVWNTKVWDDVRNIFADDGNGSRIMLTTRLADVAAYPDSNSPVHEMRFMKDSQSWDLLKAKVFANNNCPPRLKDIGKQIATRCGGLPLAVVLVAGILSGVNKSQSSWEEISKNVNPIVGLELEGILSLSYTHLPHHLRPCFLFIGFYLEDENIHASMLIRLWLAEGFLKHQVGWSKSLEEQGEEYLEDLVKRNLVMVTSRKINGKIKCCSLHDMVRDLCIRKGHYERFLRVMDGRDVVPQGMMNERRVSLRLSDIDNIWSPNIHTILCFQIQSLPSLPAFLRRFRLLRILDTVGDNSKELPYQVFELFHLRYLCLIFSSDIPSAISNLVNLQTLVIFPNFHVNTWKKHWRICRDVSHFSLPLEIWRMPQLRHLVLYDLYMLPHPPRGSNLLLKNLQTLSYIKDLIWTEDILQMIPNVKKLGLVYQVDQVYHLHLLKHLHQLEKLEVCGFRSFSWLCQNPAFPTTLKKLSLVGGGFPWEDMSIIGSLPNLQVLKLQENACHGDTWETAIGEFPQLRFLLIEDSYLKHWISESSHFPRLKCLVLRFCWYLEEIPNDIGEIPTLELIQVEYDNKSLVKSVKKIEEDQQSFENNDLHVRVFHSHEISRERKRYRH